jgi:hypothetical protein
MFNGKYWSREIKLSDMLKNLLYFLLVMACSCSSRHNAKKGWVLDSIPRPTSFGTKRVSPWIVFNACLDSAKSFKPGMALPAFFYNYLLDYENPWLGSHHSYSIRKMIFDSTNDVHILREIIVSKDPRLKTIADSSMVSLKELLNALPYKELSNYEMAKRRLSELQKYN